MKKHLLALSFISYMVPQLHAQVTPGNEPGDLGWMMHGTDTLWLVRAADGHVWLQQNLGSSRVATAIDDQEAYGDLYQWGRWDDGHQSRTSAVAQASTLTDNDPSGLGEGSPFFYIGQNPADWWSAGTSGDSWQGTMATSTRGIDPCAAFGTDWKIPSQEDWMNLISLESITDLATAFNSNLKLIAAGSRDGQTGTLINAGQYGNYWSTTANGLYAKDVTIGEGFINADDDAYRSYGMSVRCINQDLSTDIQHTTTADDLLLFPNPSQGRIEIQGNRLIEHVEIHDLLSRCIQRFTLNAASGTIELTDLPAGTYLLRLSTVDGWHNRTIVITR